MPTKRQQADAAYERAEDQRALAHVLDMAARNIDADTPTLDAIERVRAKFLTVTPPIGKHTPEAHDVLPGQLDIEGRVAGEPARNLGAPMAEAFDVPKQCPGCGENMLLVWGGSWTPLAHIHPDAPCALQCAYCAYVVLVSERQYEAVQAERRRTIGESDRKPAKKAAVTGRTDAKRGAR